MTARILLLDDHKILREGLSALLSGHAGFTVVGQASNGIEAIRMVNQLEPDVAVLDIMVPDINGLEVARQVANRARVVILSMHSNEAYVLEALRNGALGYVLKDSAAEDLVHAIEQVMRGRRYLSPAISDLLIDSYLTTASENTDPYEALSPREREVFLLVASGRTNHEIGQLLSLSPRTVEVHRGNMMHKLGLVNQTELIRLAIQRGVIAA